MLRPFALTFVLYGVAPVLLAGCGSSTSVSGRVTYETKPVGNGAITFLPADGHGPVVGAPIVDGNYQIDNLVPGKKTVQIVAVKKVNFALSNEEMERRARESAKRGDTTGIVERADEISPDADGNNRQVEVKPGSQTFDFDLKPKVRP
jgi:hypothetical protein